LAEFLEQRWAAPPPLDHHGRITLGILSDAPRREKVDRQRDVIAHCEAEIGIVRLPVLEALGPAMIVAAPFFSNLYDC
jgi:hypothetical protein